jgi:hypothetical protein
VAGSIIPWDAEDVKARYARRAAIGSRTQAKTSVPYFPVCIVSSLQIQPRPPTKGEIESFT